MRGRIILCLVAVVMAAALLSLPLWPDGVHGAAPWIVISLLSLLANVSVLGQPMPARHRHQEPRGRGPA